MKELIFEGMGIMYMLAVIVMLIVVAAIGVDFVSGWRKAKLRGDERTSYAASRSLTKILIYEGLVIIGILMDTMIHFAWAMFMDSAYYVPLAAIVFATILCIVEAWSVREKADRKQRKRMDEAAAALAQILDKETVLALLQNRIRATKDDEEEYRPHHRHYDEECG
jgi:hypothetical protein